MPHNPNTTATQHTQNQMSETQGILKAGSQLPAASAKVLAWNNPGAEEDIETLRDPSATGDLP